MTETIKRYAVVLAITLVCNLVRGDEYELPPKPDSPPTITFWYGDQQQFGTLGDTQPLINILGSIKPASQAANLWYQLNNERPKQLLIGPDLHRLARPGDFNVELERSRLKPGKNTFRISLHDLWGRKQTRELTINYVTGKAWPLPYALDFSQVQDLQSVVDVIDGKWQLTKDGVRTAVPCYDRVLAFGDSSWQDTELHAELIFHQHLVSFKDRVRSGPPYLSHAHASFNMRWAGFPDDQKTPRRDWQALGSLVALRCDLAQLKAGSYWWMHYGHARRNVKAKRSEMRRETRFPIELEQRYHYRMQVTTIADGHARYSAKVWKDGDPEPKDWQMVGDDLAETVPAGALAFVVHHSDVTLCKIEVKKIEVKKIEVKKIEVKKIEVKKK